MPNRNLKHATRSIQIPLLAAAVAAAMAAAVAGGAIAQTGPQPGDIIKDCPVCPEMVVIPPGTFFMGAAKTDPERRKEEGPRHQARIPNSFAIGRFEVTFAQWDACIAAGGCGHRPQDRGWGRGNLPVICI